MKPQDGIHAGITSPRMASASASAVPAHRPICPDCHAEIIDPLARRYRYPFTACKHCGPQQPPLPVTLAPDDIAQQPSTSATAGATDGWPMCDDCHAEQDDATSRRHHAPFVACHACGPRAWLERTDGAAYVPDMHSMLDAVDAVCTLLQQGQVVAVPTPAGYRLAVQATHAAAVSRLPWLADADADTAIASGALLLLARDPRVLQAHVHLPAAAAQLLEQRKPVLLHGLPRENTSPADPLELPIGAHRRHSIRQIGCLLPQTPLQVLMLRRMEQPVLLLDPAAACLADAPLAHPPTAREQLRSVADYVLMQDAWWLPACPPALLHRPNAAAAEAPPTPSAP